MRIAVVGSRNYHNLEQVRQYVLDLPKDSTIVSGGAKGVDTIATIAAVGVGLETITFFPDWNTHGKAAGMIRNSLIVESSDAVVAFWDGKSKGTKDTIDKALKDEHIQWVKVFKNANP